MPPSSNGAIFNEAVDVGGSVPFLGKPQLLDSIMCRQTIGPRSKLGLKFRVTSTGQELRWRFRAIKGKMSFTIYRQKIINKRHHPTVRFKKSTSSIEDLMSDSTGNTGHDHPSS